MRWWFSWIGLAATVAGAVACGPVVEDEAASAGDTEVPESCRAGAEDEVCQEEFAALCSTRTDAVTCEQTQGVPGGVSLDCLWIEPSVVRLDGNECIVEPAEPRCVGIAYPGDIGCTMWTDEGGRILVVQPEHCFPLEWNVCMTHEPRECDCSL